MATILQWSIVHTIIQLFFAPLIQVIEWVAKSELAFSQRFLGSPRGEHYKLLEENIWRKVVSTSKKRFWREINAFSSQFYYRSIKMMSIRGKSKFLIVTTKYVIRYTEKLNFSPCARSVVKSSSLSGLQILQNQP